MVVVGAVADAPVVITRDAPAAPNANAAFPRFRMGLLLACVMESLALRAMDPHQFSDPGS